jgi:hypothetical protein
MKKKRNYSQKINLHSKKIALLNRLRKKVDKVTDTLGMPIDEGIKEAVIMFNAVGLNTTASCEGHLDHGIPAPWVHVAALNEPKEQFIGEKEIFRKVARKYNLKVEEVRRGYNIEALEEAGREIVKNEETKEYKRWRKENKKLLKKAKKFLNEFYKNRKVKPDMKLTIEIFGDDSFRIHNGGKYYKSVKDLSAKEKKKVEKMLEKFREEMNAFTEFLKSKYFSPRFKLPKIKGKTFKFS